MGVFCILFVLLEFTTQEVPFWVYLVRALLHTSLKIIKGRSHKLELELIQTHMIQKPLMWVEVGKRQECLWGFANCASLCLLDMSRSAAHFWTFSHFELAKAILAM